MIDELSKKNIMKSFRIVQIARIYISMVVSNSCINLFFNINLFFVIGPNPFKNLK